MDCHYFILRASALLGMALMSWTQADKDRACELMQELGQLSECKATGHELVLVMCSEERKGYLCIRCSKTWEE